MAMILKQSTAFTFRIGPFLDDTDGKTAETGLTIAQADIQISKNGGAFAQTSAAPTTTHDADGWYQCPLTETDTNTLGTLTVQIIISGALPVWEHFTVVPAERYTSMIAGTTSLSVNLLQILGTTLTETVGGYITAAFKKLFDIATPVFTAANVNQSADNNTILAHATYGNAAINTKIGTPVALDGGAATIGGMLTKMADDNSGASFDATYDSLEKISAGVNLGGAYAITFTAVDETAAVVASVLVQIINISSVTINSGTTNSSGVAVINLDAGTYTVRAYKAGVSYTDTTLVVAAAAAVTLTGANVTGTTGLSDYQVTVTTIKGRLLDWMESNNTGNNVADDAVDLLNRAQRSLWEYRPWDDLFTTSSLTMSGATASMPTGCAKPIFVYHDSDSDNKADYFYYRQGRYDDGYDIKDTFTRTTGHSYAITFYKAPLYTPKVAYQAILADFTGSGTEYTFFPADLLLIEAQYIRTCESGTGGEEWKAISSRRAELLRDYEQGHHWTNADMRVIQLDAGGSAIANNQYSVDGGTNGLSNDREPDYDMG